jgi:putative transposase
MVGKRHASDEIAGKLAHADRLAASGKTQREIAKALGISIMTYHRWKKSANQGDGERRRSVNLLRDTRTEASTAARSGDLFEQMELENNRLRRLVTDLLLEKLKLEEELRRRTTVRFSRPR